MKNKKNKINKKGFLLGETTVKVVIAVIVIILLVYLVVRIFGTYSDKQKREQAQNLLNDLTVKVNSLNDGETVQYIVRIPNNWGIESPEQGLLCVCEEPAPKGECQIKGICNNLNYNFELRDKQIISGIFSDSDIDLDYILLRNLPKTINIKKQNNKVEIYTY